MITDNEHYLTINNRFPHIGEKIVKTWGTIGFVKLIENLMYDTRDGKRQGFPADVALALFRLSAYHDEVFPIYARSPSDIWSVNNKII